MNTYHWFMIATAPVAAVIWVWILVSGGDLSTFQRWVLVMPVLFFLFNWADSHMKALRRS